MYSTLFVVVVSLVHSQALEIQKDGINNKESALQPRLFASQVAGLLGVDVSLVEDIEIVTLIGTLIAFLLYLFAVQMSLLDWTDTITKDLGNFDIYMEFAEALDKSYFTQTQFELKQGWSRSIKNDLEHIDIFMKFDEIEEFKKEKFKKTVKKACKQKTLDNLLSEDEEKKKIVKLKDHNLGEKNSLLCCICKLQEDNEPNLYECEKLKNEIPEALYTNIKYEDSTDILKLGKVSKLLFKILKEKKVHEIYVVEEIKHALKSS